MKRLELSDFVILLGCFNWIIVLGILALFFSFPKGLPSHTLGSILGVYLFASFVPALISTIMTIKVKKRYKIFNLTINIIFLLIYAIFMSFSVNLALHG